MLKFIGYGAAAIVGWYVVDVHVLGNTVPPYQSGERPEVCEALRVIAVSAFDSKLRGVTREAMQAINDSQARRNGTSERNRIRIREATAIGYSASTSSEAGRRARQRCEEGLL